MRRIFACLLHFEGDPESVLPAARARVRRWAAMPWGGWPDGAPAEAGSFSPDAERLVRWRSLSSPQASVRELVLDEPLADDQSLRQITSVLTGAESGRSFAHVEVSLRSTDPTLTGPVAYENDPPEIVAELVEHLRVCDAHRPLSADAWTLSDPDVPAFGRLVMEPERRLPVLLLVTSELLSAVDAGRMAAALAGLAHVAVLDKRKVDDLAERSGVAIQQDVAAQLWWPTRRSVHGEVNRHWYRATELTPSATGLPGWNIIRSIFAVSAFRIGTPGTLARLAAHDARRKIEQLESRSQANGTDTELLQAYEADLAQLDAAQQQVSELEAEVERLQDDLSGLVSSFDDAVTAALVRGRTQAPPPPNEPANLADAVTLAAAQCEHLLFLPDAHESARDWTFRRPAVVLDALLALDRLAAQWRRGDLPGGFTPAAKAAGLPWRPLISRTAQTRFRDDYVRIYRDEEVLLGPHLGWGNSPDNGVRIYLHLDRVRRIVVVGHVGEHLRDTTKPH